jgi:hypothetical protein
MASALLGLTLIAVWQESRMRPPEPPLNWSTVGRRDLVTAALFLDVQEGGPGLALEHLAQLAARDSGISEFGHVYAHEIGRYALARRGWDPAVYAECTPRFESGCYHGVVEAYVGHAPLDSTVLRRLCERIVGQMTPEVARRECAHGLGHGLWFRLRGRHREALTYCDHLMAAVSQEECRDGVFMQRAGTATAHAHHSTGSAPVSLRCSEEPAPYRHACWHYQGSVFLTAAGGVTSSALSECDSAGDYAGVCYWGMGKTLADRVRGAGGTNQQIIDLCSRGKAAMLGACLAGAVENLVDENWTTGGAETLCRDSPTVAKASCYTKLGERIGILYPSRSERIRACAAMEPAYRTACEEGARPVS